MEVPMPEDQGPHHQQEQPLQPFEPKFSLSYIFHVLFSDSQCANWLLSDDPYPPETFDKKEMQLALSADSIAVESKEFAEVFKKTEWRARKRDKTSEKPRGDDGEPDELDRSNSSDSSPLDLVINADVEKVVWVCHGMTETCGFFSMTDTRTPFVFMEKHSPARPGVRRAVGKKVDNGFIYACCYKLIDGKSNFIVQAYRFKPYIFSERHLVLMASYPSYRYPEVSDVLESIVTLDTRHCFYCAARGYYKCQCSVAMQHRAIAGLSSGTKQNSWSVWQWCLESIENIGLKHDLMIHNVAKNVTVLSSGFSAVRPTHPGDGSGLRTYMKCLEPVIANRLVYHRNNMLTANESESMRGGNLFQDLGQNLQQGQQQQRREYQQRYLMSQEEDPQIVIRDGCGETSPQAAMVMDVQDDQTLLANQPTHSLLDMKHKQDALDHQDSLPASRRTEGCKNSVSISRRDSDIMDVRSYAAASASGSAMVTMTAGSHVPQTVPPSVTASRGNTVNPMDAAAEHDDASLSDPLGDHASGGITEAERNQVLALMQELDNQTWDPSTRENCKLCGVSFARKHDLKRHLRLSHLCERGYQCNLCSSKFKRRNHLMVHHKAVHEHSSSYQCFYCAKTFSSDSSRRRHIRTFHPHESVQPAEKEVDSML